MIEILQFPEYLKTDKISGFYYFKKVDFWDRRSPNFKEVKRQTLVRIGFYIGNEVNSNIFVYYLHMTYPIVHVILAQMYKNVSSTPLLCHRFTQKLLLLLDFDR